MTSVDTIEPVELDEDILLQQVEEALEADRTEDASALLSELTDSDARHLFFALDEADQDTLLSEMPAEQVAELIEPLPNVEIALLLERIEPEAAARILENLETVDTAGVLDEFDRETAEAIEPLLDQETSNELADLASYDEDTAGWFMDREPITFLSTQTIGNVLKLIVEDDTALDSAEGQHPYVVTPEGILIGVLPLKALLLAKRSTPIVEAMIEPEQLDPDMTLDELKDFFDEWDFLGAPVVDEAGLLLGVVSKETVMDAWREKLQENAQKARGVVADELRSMPLLFRSRRRLMWLTANIGLNIIAASVISSFEDTLAAVIALAIFLPMVSDMSGCSGNQAVAVSMREISLGLARPSDLLKVWWKEVSVGVINGLILGLIIGLVAFVWKGNPVLGLVIGVALAINTVIAVSIGGCVPLILKRFGTDPAVASGPLLTTITDMAGFFLVLGLATLLLPYLV